MYYDHRTDEYIKEFIVKVRKKTLNQDLKRHQRALFLKNIGFPVRSISKEELKEWIGRLKKIIKKEDQTMHKKIYFLAAIDAAILVLDIFLIWKMVSA